MVKDKDVLQYEILRQQAKAKNYKNLAKNLGFNDIKQMTNLAVKESNISALMGLAQSNVYAVTAELASSPDYSRFFATKFKENQGKSFIPKLFFMVRTHAPKSLKLLLQRLTRSIILQTSLNISGRGFKGKTRHRVRYYPGVSEFDLEETMFHYIQNNRILTMKDIVGIERRQRKRNIVLILDTSGSMFGKLLLNAALTTSVLSYAMSKDFTSVILFSQESYVLKNIKETRSVTKLIDQILESEAVGFTNISKGLKTGLNELNKVRGKGGRKSIGVLISDGDYNRGINPKIVARLYPKLHVIGMPQETSREKRYRGEKVCREIATAGRGIYKPVDNFNEIPRILMKLLSQL
jgi:Mg-chelatase subunit ChlD